MRKIEAPAELLLAAVLAHEAVQPALKTACQPEIVTVDGEDQSVVEDRAVEPVGDYEFESERSAAVIGALLPFVDPGEAVHPPLRGLADRGRDRGGLKSVAGGLQPVEIAQRNTTPEEEKNFNGGHRHKDSGAQTAATRAVNIREPPTYK